MASLALVVILVAVMMNPVVALGDESSLLVGIIGCETAHAPAFTKIINAENGERSRTGLRVVAAFPGGSEDIPKSRERVEGFSEELVDLGIEIVETIEELLERVDVVLLLSVDGRTHLEQSRKVFQAGKPVYFDKPFAGSLVDAMAIVELAQKHKVPFFSSSALRYEPPIFEARDDPEIGRVEGCIAFSPCSIEPTHPDLYWYGIHGVESLYTIMGPGCEWVVRVHSKDADVVTGTWNDGRLGTFRGQRTGPHDYGALVFGTKSTKYISSFGGYEPLVDQIIRFFKSGIPPVSAEETLEMFAFMDAAEESKRRGGMPVSLASVIAKARAELAERP